MTILPKLAATATLLIAGCATVPADLPEPDPVSPPPTWRNTAGNAYKADRQWWLGFSDEWLARLVARAIGANHDLAGAAARLASAHALTKAAAAERLPHIDLEVSTAKQRPPTTPLAGGSEGGARARLPSAHQAGLRASFDIDVAGRLSRTERSAIKEALAAKWDLEAVRIATIHAVVATYLEYRYTIAILRSTVERRCIGEELIRIERFRERAGVAPARAVRDAENLLSEIDKELSLLRRTAEMSRAQLAVLVGASPQEPAIAPPVESKLPTALRVPSDAPAEVLALRPDVRAAWAKVEAAGIDAERTRLERFPRLALTGALGLASGALAGFLRKDAMAWMLGVEASAPLFDGGRIEARIEQAQAHRESTVAAYRQTVLAALQDAEQALAALSSADRLRAEAGRALDRALQNEREAEREFAAGRVGRGTPRREEMQRILAAETVLGSERDFAIASANVFLAFGYPAFKPQADDIDRHGR